MEISVGHTPDSDDAFMFYAMFTDKVKSEEFSVTHVIEDIENSEDDQDWELSRKSYRNNVMTEDERLEQDILLIF